MKISRPTRPLENVNVFSKPDGSKEIEASFMFDPDMIFGEKNTAAFMALDASKSMKKMYGLGGLFSEEPNYVQAVARKIGSILCLISKSGSVSGIYWAVTADGNATEEAGHFDKNSWSSANITGPRKKEDWGRGTKLLPVIRYAFEKVSVNSEYTIGVILTDGLIEDEQDSINYCLKVGQEMADGQRNPVKLILIGIGEEVDEDQLERFDDMFENNTVNGKKIEGIDIWSHGMVESMQNEDDIYAVLYGELMDENIDVAPTGRVEDPSGNQVASWGDGMPGKFRFVLPKGCSKFVVKVGNKVIEQDISEAMP